MDVSTGLITLTTREAANRLALTHETVRRYINRGLLRAEKRGRDWFIPLSEIERYTAIRRPAGRPATSSGAAVGLDPP